MRWKLLRRRLSPPRVTVRRHLPWPLRWLSAALMLGFSAAIALWAFETGKDLAGLDRSAKAELARLREEQSLLREERDKAQAVANTAESLLKTEKAADAIDQLFGKLYEPISMKRLKERLSEHDPELVQVEAIRMISSGKLKIDPTNDQILPRLNRIPSLAELRARFAGIPDQSGKGAIY